MLKSLGLTLWSNNVNGRPFIRLTLDGIVHYDSVLTEEITYLLVTLDDTTVSNHTLQLIRYGKTYENVDSINDQTVILQSIEIDGVKIPDYIIHQSTFTYADVIEHGSLEFGPNGIWEFVFTSPIITDLMDRKIQHEMQYTEDYKYPWSYVLSTSSVTQITQRINNAINKVRSYYES